MKQINSDQIIDNGIPDNTIKAIPRDLSALKNNAKTNPGAGFVNLAGSAPVGDIGQNEPATTPTTSPVPLPDTPAFIGVKSQNVKIKEDGTYLVDIVIEVEDVRNVSDYEVRISKGAGTV